jgi:hypothetical protein
MRETSSEARNPALVSSSASACDACAELAPICAKAVNGKMSSTTIKKVASGLIISNSPLGWLRTALCGPAGGRLPNVERHGSPDITQARNDRFE